MASDEAKLGTVADDEDTEVAVYREADGAVAFWAPGIGWNIRFPAAEAARLAGLLDRAAMPGQVPPAPAITLYGCCGHCEDGDGGKPCGIQHRHPCAFGTGDDCEPGHKVFTATVTEAGRGGQLFELEIDVTFIPRRAVPGA